MEADLQEQLSRKSEGDHGHSYRNRWGLTKINPRADRGSQSLVLSTPGKESFKATSSQDVKELGV